MASVDSKTDQIVDEKLEKKDADEINLDGEENTSTYSAKDSEEKPESEDFSIVEGIKDSETQEKTDVDSNSPTSIEVNVKDLENQTGSPDEQKKEILNSVAPHVSEAPETDVHAPTSTEISVDDLQVQSAFPEEQKQEITTETQEPISNEATIDSGGEVAEPSSVEENASGDAEAVQEKEESLEEKTENPVERLEAKTQLAQNSTDLSAAEVSSDQGTAPKTAQVVEEEKDMRFNIEKEEAVEATVKDLNIVTEVSEVPSKDKEVSASDERKTECLKEVDATSVKAPKEFTTVEESPEQVIEVNKSDNSKKAPAETSSDFETPETAAEILKDIGPSEMVVEKKNDTKDHSLVERNVQISDDKEEETHPMEPIQIATDKSEKKELGAEKEESEKSKEILDPIISSDTADTRLIKDQTKRESNSFFSKVKRSIVKTKKAILGKSPGPKTVSSEIKDDNT